MSVQEENENLKKELEELKKERRVETDNHFQKLHSSITKVGDKIDKMNLAETECRAHVTSVLTKVEKQCDEHSTVINGPAGKPEEGLIMRTTTLEKGEKIRRKIVWGIVGGIGTIIGAALTYFLQRLISGKPPTHP